ncbi:hypothetical protein [Halobacteriovorax sp.]|uniref:hypothetical protein n=1 Tax=Halobacteriovorax sp. TaxID=2020862 RepID=UPI003569503E
MKVFKVFFLLLLSVNTFAASTTVNPFSIEFYTNKNTINVKAKLTLACRYEKVVWSDSAEYNTEYKDIDLTVSNKDQRNGLTKHTLSLTNKQYLEVTGIFKPTKGCKSEIRFDLNDANYSIGWANQFSRPISFSYWNFKSYSSDDTIFRPTTLRDQIEGKLLSFNYTPVSSQVNVSLLADGERVTEILGTNVALNKETNMPYRLK